MRRTSVGLKLSLTLTLAACATHGAAVSSPGGQTLPVAAAGSGVPGDDEAEATIKETVDLSKDEWIALEGSPGTAALVPGATAVAKKQWAQARRSLEVALGGLQNAPIDQQFAGLALLGRACDFLNDRKAAEKAYGAILDVWKGETTVRAAIASAGHDGKARREAVQRVLLAVGEALYFMSAEKPDDNDASPPRYTRETQTNGYRRSISAR